MTTTAGKPQDRAAADAKRLEALTRDGIALMRDERAAVVGGDFEALESIAERKTELLTEIERRGQALAAAPKTGEAQQRHTALQTLTGILSRRAAENAALLEAAMKGAEKARATMDKITGSPPELGVYTRSGERLSIQSDKQRKTLKL